MSNIRQLNPGDMQEISDFLRRNPMAVLSTSGGENGAPESALIAFAEMDNLEIIFETFIDTRKYKNLFKNHHVSLVVGWDAQVHITVQYEGIAELVSENDLEHYKQIFLKKETPCTEVFINDPRAILFKLRPVWLRYSDYTSDNARIIEADFPV